MKILVGFRNHSTTADFPQAWEPISGEYPGYIYSIQQDNGVLIRPFIGFEIIGDDAAALENAKESLQSLYLIPKKVTQVDLDLVGGGGGT